MKLSWKRRLLSNLPLLGKLDRTVQTARWCEWVKQQHCPIYPNREALYRAIRGKVGVIEYLEFGVADGASIGLWAQIDPHPRSRFTGFDSFQGLPEDWYAQKQRGTFARGGTPPDIRDARVAFQIGLFQDVLPDFLIGFKPRGYLVVHCDADLYSSTLYVLTQLNPVAEAGTIVIFDEFWDAQHEFRALMDYCAAYQRSFTVLGAANRFSQVAVQLR